VASKLACRRIGERRQSFCLSDMESRCKEGRIFCGLFHSASLAAWTNQPGQVLANGLRNTFNELKRNSPARTSTPQDDEPAA
jgi:hypothetical protein